MDLSSTSANELREELKRRKVAEEKPKIRKITFPVDSYKLQEACRKYINMMSNECQFKDEEKVHIFEAAIELFYGEDVWDWIQKRQDELES